MEDGLFHVRHFAGEWLKASLALIIKSGVIYIKRFNKTVQSLFVICFATLKIKAFDLQGLARKDLG